MTRWVSVRVTPAMYDEVRRLAAEEHRSVNGTIQEAIERYLRSRHRLPRNDDGR